MDIAPYLYGLAILVIVGLLYAVSQLRDRIDKIELNHKIELFEESEGQRELEENYNQDFLQMEESLNRNKDAVGFLYAQLELKAGESAAVDREDYMHNIRCSLDHIANGRGRFHAKTDAALYNRGLLFEETPMPADDPIPGMDEDMRSYPTTTDANVPGA